jgi:hypothetical protein
MYNYPSDYGFYFETEAERKAREKREGKQAAREARQKVAQYLKTLRRVPDDIVLSTATRHLDLGMSNSCLCGTFIRESLSQMRQTAFERTKSNHDGNVSIDTTAMCEVLFGGEEADWELIFEGVVYDDAPLIEEAFVTRVLEAIDTE